MHAIDYVRDLHAAFSKTNVKVDVSKQVYLYREHVCLYCKNGISSLVKLF